MDPTQVQTVSQAADVASVAGIPLIAWIPLLPLLGALINLTIGRRFSKITVHTIAIAAVAGACGLAIYLVFGPLLSSFPSKGLDTPPDWWTWFTVGSFKVALAFHLDTLSAVMVLIITFVGTLIHIYSTGYMAHDPRYSAYFGYLNLFTGAMLILVLGANMPVMFIGWEGVGLCSFLLIGFWYENDTFAYAGRKAFVVNRIGDFCFLLGMFLLFWATRDSHAGDAARGSLDFMNLREPSLAASSGAPFIHSPFMGWRLSAIAGVLLFIGACGKSAQIPLYVWLPDAMAGPTPVSALIHAATMVTAGVYMICRLSFLYSTSTDALAVVATIGLLTALVAAFMAMAQTDLKKVLAYSTVSQLGFMFVAAGTGNWTAAIFHLMTHAFFKACLFLGAGSVMHGMEHGGSKEPGNILKMGGLRKHMKITHVTFLISCLAIAGIVPFAGFFSKDEILGGAWGVHPPGWVPQWYGKVLWGGLLVAALGTAFYMWRLYFLVFGGEERSEEAKHAHESPWSMTVPLIILAGLATLAGAIGLPENFDTPHWTHLLHDWLAPSLTENWHDGGKIAAEGAPMTTLVLMGVALVVGLAGIGIAAMFYAKGPTPTVKKLVDGPLAGLREASANKLWVDEIYDAIIVRPFKLLARGLFEVVDRFIIDTVAVNGAAFVVGIFARISRWFQNGQVQRYLVGVVIGAAAVFFVTSWEEKPSFEYRIIGDQLELSAKPGAGLIEKTAKLEWDIDGDGKPDSDPATGQPLAGAVVKLRYGDVTASSVTLVITDPVTREVKRVSRKIELPEAAPPATSQEKK